MRLRRRPNHVRRSLRRHGHEQRQLRRLWQSLRNRASVRWIDLWLYSVGLERVRQRLLQPQHGPEELRCLRRGLRGW